MTRILIESRGDAGPQILDGCILGVWIRRGDRLLIQINGNLLSSGHRLREAQHFVEIARLHRSKLNKEGHAVDESGQRTTHNGITPPLEVSVNDPPIGPG